MRCLIDADWRPLKRYEGRYEITKEGLIRNRHGRVLSPYQGEYLTVVLTGEGFRRTERVHRLLAENFLSPYSGEQVNHKNGDKYDNRLENLEWCTPSENVKHSYQEGLASNRGTRHSRSILTEEDIPIIRSLIAQGISCRIIGERFSVKGSAIDSVKRGKTWAHVV